MLAELRDVLSRFGERWKQTLSFDRHWYGWIDLIEEIERPGEGKRGFEREDEPVSLALAQVPEPRFQHAAFERREFVDCSRVDQPGDQVEPLFEIRAAVL